MSYLRLARSGRLVHNSEYLYRTRGNPILNILFATSEAVPFCKTGGLGDVCGSLPRALAELGHSPSIILPAFRQVYQAGVDINPTGVEFDIPIGQKQVHGRYLRSTLPDSEVPVFFVDCPEYFDRHELYREKGEDYRDNCERFAFFSRAAIRAIALLDLGTEVLHCHDWQTGLIPAYLKTMFGDRPPYDQVATLYTIHNLAYQGSFWHWDMALTGIDWKYFNWRQMEFYGNLNFMKTAISFADAISTVSPTYAQEILRPPMSCGLEGALQQRSDELYGILNGVDYSSWNPATDSFLGEKTYDSSSFETGKAACKSALQREMGLPERPEVPLLASVGRLADQKGFDLIVRVMQQWAPHRELQWVILGTGEPKYHQMLGQMAADRPDRIGVRLAFSNELAHLIEAGADMFMMPSQYEPCGLNQLYSLKYGTVPVVRRTGGLADTVVDANPQTLAAGVATGFTFDDYTSLALADTLERACQLFADRSAWRELVMRGMQQDWSWNRSAALYAELYGKLPVGSRKALSPA